MSIVNVINHTRGQLCELEGEYCTSDKNLCYKSSICLQMLWEILCPNTLCIPEITKILNAFIHFFVLQILFDVQVLSPDLRCNKHTDNHSYFYWNWKYMNMNMSLLYLLVGCHGSVGVLVRGIATQGFVVIPSAGLLAEATRLSIRVDSSKSFVALARIQLL